MTPANDNEHKPTIVVSGFAHDLRRAICIAALQSVGFDTAEFDKGAPGE